MTDPALRDFSVTVDDSEIAHLRTPLQSTHRPDQLPEAGWDLGTGIGLLTMTSTLAGWIIEEFRSWSDGEINRAYTMDRLLEN